VHTNVRTKQITMKGSLISMSDRTRQLSYRKEDRAMRPI